MNEETITERFIQAFAELHRVREINITRFCREVGADRRNFTALMVTPTRHLLRPEWLAGVVLAYGVSADWLLTGRGMMFG